jgi:ABC-2 type transport system permease protein
MTAMTTRPYSTGAGLAGTNASEWTKLWSVRSTWWCLAGAAAMMAVFGGSVGHGAGNRPEQAAGTPPAGQMLPVEYAAMGALLLAQFALIALAVLVNHRGVRQRQHQVTLLWDPRRGRLLAKAVVLAVVMLVAGTAVAALAAVAANLLAGEYGLFVLSDVAAASVRIGCHMAAAALFALGAGTAIRSTAGALTTTFVLFLVAPYVVSQAASDLLVTVANHLPGLAGMEYIGTTEFLGIDVPYSPSGGAAILLAWTAAALLTGYAVLRMRDA